MCNFVRVPSHPIPFFWEIILVPPRKVSGDGREQGREYTSPPLRTSPVEKVNKALAISHLEE